MRFRVALPVLLLFAGDLPAQITASRDSVISIATSRTSRVVPDRASMYVVVEGTAETAVDAVARVETKYAKVIEALKGFGPRVEMDKPMAYTVGPVVNQNGYPGAATPASNLARSVIRVQITRPEQTAQVIAAVLTAGASSTSSIAFESTMADSIRRARFADALAGARADAEAIATALGGKLGALVDVITGGNNGFQQNISLNFDNRFGSQSPAPEVAVVVTVTARYRLIR